MEIDTGAILRNAKTLNSYFDDLVKEYGNIAKAIEELKTSWSGERAEKLYSAVETTFLPELKTAINSLENYYTYISSIPSAYELMDKSYSSKNIEV